MSQERVLIVDDEARMRRVLEIMLQRMGHKTCSVSNGREALKFVQTETFDLVLTDLRMPEMDGVELLDAIHAQDVEIPVIILTAYGTVENAVEAMKKGAYDYILRPFDVEAVERVITRALTAKRIRRENVFLREEIKKGWGEFVGRAPAMQQMYDLIQQVAPSNTNVLITGETGTGKELAARAIHHASPRTEALFVPINCAAIPADILESELFGYTRGAFTGASRDRMGKFELANGGTLFLDEITEMSPSMQAKLLRVLQEREVERLGSHRRLPVDIRLIVATNRNPYQAVQDGTLREDLFYRINVFTLEIPPLRQHVEDISVLVNHFLEQHGSKLGKDVLSVTRGPEQLRSYPLPGMSRLEKYLERAVSYAERSDHVSIYARNLLAPDRVSPREIVHRTSNLPPSYGEKLNRAFYQSLISHKRKKAKSCSYVQIMSVVVV